MRRPARLALALAGAVAGVAIAATGTTGVGPRESAYVDGAGITVQLGPRLIAPGPTPEPAADAGYSGQVSVDGVGAGHTVEIQKWVDGGWQSTSTLRTSPDGSVAFVASGDAWYRAVATVEGAARAQRFTAGTNGPLVWLSEEFEDETFQFEWQSVDQPADSGRCSRADPDRSVIKDGVLELSVGLDKDVRCDRRGSVGRTNGHFVVDSQLGLATVAARVRFPHGSGSAGRVWLQPAGATSPWVVDDDHDGVLIAGTVPGSPSALETGVRWLDPSGKMQRHVREVRRDQAPWADGEFHVYSVDWLVDQLVFRVDGQPVNTVTGGYVAFPQTIGVALLSPDSLDFDAQSEDGVMEVDWVRVYSLTSP
ncbi:glycoside hydrolase family 16 protein [Nocardioides sp.]|uniref:glycoside hydrolase family 16 protein n=1 Tax=Nocardioides sp. TaxID=35761 RepID=UPI002BEA2407|nr:glycoside hydrolase family 16 protein [Nocardioides sp.]HXH80921.1 glycoside hydrolase family 16 protein [Nocardioides sp.]